MDDINTENISSESDIYECNTTLSTELTTTLFCLNSSIESMVRAFSAIPQHPYDCTKAMFFDEGYIFPTVHDIEVPETVTLDTLIQGFERSHNTYQNNVLDYISAPEKYDLTASGNHLNLLSELSGENQFVTTPDKYRSYISTLEAIQNIKLDDITDENCIDLVHKLGYSVLNTFQRKTVN